MKVVRRSADRGHADHGWLKSYHSFSFAEYFDEDHVEFGPLRVLNEDRVAGGQGFGTHGHRNMEIISYVLEGVLSHQDSIGTRSTIRPGDVQRMSAGTGVSHSEFNPSPSEACHLLQIWIMPKVKKLTPSYEQKFFGEDERREKLCLIASDDGGAGAVTIHQDARVYASLLDAGQSITHQLDESRSAWLQVARGSLSLNGQVLSEGDGAAITSETELTVSAADASEFLLFDLA